MLQEAGLGTHTLVNPSLETDSGTFYFLHVLLAPLHPNIPTSHVCVSPVSLPGDFIVLNIPAAPFFAMKVRLHVRAHYGGGPGTTNITYIIGHFEIRIGIEGHRCLPHYIIESSSYVTCLRYSVPPAREVPSPYEEAATTDPTAVRANTNSLLSLDQAHQDALRAFHEATSAYVRTSMRCAHTKLTHKRLRTHHRLSGAHLAIGMQTDASRRPLPCPSTYVRLERTVMVWLRPPRRVFPCSASVSAAASFSSSDPSAAAACRTRSFCAL